MDEEMAKQIKALDKGIVQTLAQAKRVAAELRRLSEERNKPADLARVKENIRAVNRLHEQLAGFKLADQVEKTIPLPPKAKR